MAASSGSAHHGQSNGGSADAAGAPEATGGLPKSATATVHSTPNSAARVAASLGSLALALAETRAAAEKLKSAASARRRGVVQTLPEASGRPHGDDAGASRDGRDASAADAALHALLRDLLAVPGALEAVGRERVAEVVGVAESGRILTEAAALRPSDADVTARHDGAIGAVDRAGHGGDADAAAVEQGEGGGGGGGIDGGGAVDGDRADAPDECGVDASGEAAAVVPSSEVGRVEVGDAVDAEEEAEAGGGIGPRHGVIEPPDGDPEAELLEQDGDDDDDDDDEDDGLDDDFELVEDELAATAGITEGKREHELLGAPADDVLYDQGYEEMDVPHAAFAALMKGNWPDFVPTDFKPKQTEAPVDEMWPAVDSTYAAPMPSPRSDDLPAVVAEDASGGDGGATDGADAAGGQVSPQTASQKLRQFMLPIIYETTKTGFQEEKELQFEIGDVVAGRYRVVDLLGSAAFSSALACEELETGAEVCLKVIKNNKDFFDQSLDEIKLLQHINEAGDADSQNVLCIQDFFYHKEHLFLVTELLKDNLYEFQRYLLDAGEEAYFTHGRIQQVARQCLEALAYVHDLGIVHCDLKPENILIRSYSMCEVKVIDFGSSCYTTDTLTSYIQSRSYRAPEVVLGMPYGPKIDIWSLGCIVAELWSADVLFHNDSIQTMLARISSILGPFSEDMLSRSKKASQFFTPQRLLYQHAGQADGEETKASEPESEEADLVTLLRPMPGSLAEAVPGADEHLLSFMSFLLQKDPAQRPSAVEALRHPFFSVEYPMEAYVLPTVS